MLFSPSGDQHHSFKPSRPNGFRERPAFSGREKNRPPSMEEAPPPAAGKKGRLSGFRRFIYNPETKACIGRTPKSWGGITLFYIVFYSILAAYFAILLFISQKTLDINQPKLLGDDTLLKGNPGLGFRPQPDISKTLIVYNMTSKYLAKPYLDNLDKFTAAYDEKKQKDTMDCSKLKRRKDMKAACRFDLKDLGTSCTKKNSFGFFSGSPCVLIKLNKIYGWQPAPYSKGSVPKEIRKHWKADHVTVTCKGQNPPDKDNTGQIQYFPANGIHFRYFPYNMQKGFVSPLVAVQFTNITRNQVILVTCRIWAKNIAYNFNKRAGSINFELFVLDVEKRSIKKKP